MYVPAVPDVQGDKAKSKPVLLKFERGLLWRLGGAGPSASTSLVKHGEKRVVVAAWVTWADHRLIRALVKQTLRRAGLVRAFAWANNRKKVASCFQRPPTSMANARMFLTSLQRRDWRSSGLCVLLQACAAPT